MGRALTWWLLFFFLSFSSVVEGVFVCKDKNRRQCANFRKNIARSAGKRDSPDICRFAAGNDYQFMLINCPKTCNLCSEAADFRKREEDNRRMLVQHAKDNFVEGIDEACGFLADSIWKGQENHQFVLAGDSIFRIDDGKCGKRRCKWSCRKIDDGKGGLMVQIYWSALGLHEAVLTRPYTTMEIKSAVKRITFTAELIQRNFYRVLGLSVDAPKKEVKRAYRELSKQYHPDRISKPQPEDHERFDEISSAYEILSDPDRRRIYDAMGASEFHDRGSFERAVSRGDVKRLNGGFYRNSPVVATLTSSTFESKTFSTFSQPSVVEFYAPWCYHCQQMVGKFKQTAILLENIGVTAASLDCDANRNVCSRLQIGSFPTIRFFPGLGKRSNGIQYNGDHEPESIQDFVDTIVNDRTVQLTQKTFREEVLESEDDTLVWLVDFSAGKWCGPCQQLRSALSRVARDVEKIFERTREIDDAVEDFEEASNDIRMKIRVGYINCDTAKKLCQDQHVPHYPHLRLFSRSSRSGTGVDHGEALEVSARGGAWAVLDLFSVIVRHIALAEAEATAQRRKGLTARETSPHDTDGL